MTEKILTTAKEIQKSMAVRDIPEAKELYGLIRNTNTAMSWGIHKPALFKRDSWTNMLSFKVQGFEFKGYVFITLGFDDLFDITFVNSRGTIKKSRKGVFISDLITTIAKVVEKKGTQEEYDAKVRATEYLI